eukprot:CAMPEP_0206206828 /NCGR_PEP_ID=MMETSP0166-20121206/15219_1 /ASSEMBLY_ACC=CAM_ASM_000260 /TAXON_ID=95228 /ORGANISM="Vannella robusta, Strain DIVA3 518/3/11/1/6" /LENGTH=716 /DNA_ID=CAMNT_0053627455 /DNA_START=955 /DNA_END=3105 /DNA_ORIENTATION=+
MKKSAAGSDEASRAFVENHLSSVVPHFQTVHAEPPSLAVALNADEPKEDPWIALPPLPSLSTVRDTLQSANSAPSSVTLGELKCLDNTTSSDLTKQNSKTKNSLQNSKNEPSEHSNGENTQKQVENNAIDSAEEHSLSISHGELSAVDTPSNAIKQNSDSITEQLVADSTTRENHKGEQLFLRKFAAEITKNDYDFLQGTPQHIYNSLPTTSVIPRPVSVTVAHIEGPDDLESEEMFMNHACGRTISTYPFLPGHTKREGSPICDTFQYRLYSNRAILAVTDGCNWGIRPKMASRIANKTFVEYMEDHQGSIHTVREAGHLLLRATSHAHTAIKEQAKEMNMECGSTTLFGGILLELSERVTFDEFEEDTNWVFVCVNVGDCKAFCIRNEEREVIEISIGNRTSSTDASDPGGRLGANGKPDLRNLELFCFPCRENDILIVCSDGVFDNLDPQPQGILPRDLGINVDDWEDEKLDPRVTELLFSKFRLQFLKTLLFEDDPHSKRLSTRYIVQKLLYNSLITTRSSRKYMRENPGQRLPSNYEMYPGKMDHTTALAVTVGSIAQQEVNEMDHSLPITKQWGQSSDRNQLFALDAPGNRFEAKSAVLLDIPLFENEDELLMICETPARSNVSVLVDDRNIFIRVVPRAAVNYKELLGDVFLFGINELEQPIERVVPLPCEVIPTSKKIELDHRAGFIHVRVAKKMNKDQGKAIEWISM